MEYSQDQQEDSELGHSQSHHSYNAEEQEQERNYEEPFQAAAEEESSSRHSEARDAMITSIKRVEWQVEGEEDPSQRSQRGLEDGQQSPYSTKIIAINQELQKMDSKQDAHELSYSQDDSDRDERQSTRSRKKSIQEKQASEEAVDATNQEAHQTDQQNCDNEPQQVVEAPAKEQQQQQASQRSEQLPTVLLAKQDDNNVIPVVSKASEPEVVKAFAPLHPEKPTIVRKKKPRASKKKNVTSGTYLIDAYELPGDTHRVSQPSSKALLTKYKSQDCLMDGTWLKKKKQNKPAKGTSPKRNEPIKATQHFRSMRRVLKDSIKEGVEEETRGLPKISSEKSLQRLSKQLRTLNQVHSNKILPIFYSPKSVHNRN